MGPCVISLRGFWLQFSFSLRQTRHPPHALPTVDKTVKICSPANGATVGSPVTFSAGARDNEHPVTSMIMYIDSVKKAQSANASLSAILSLPAGKHAIVIRAWDSTGFFFSSSESITVAASPTPTPTPTPDADANTNANTDGRLHTTQVQRQLPPQLPRRLRVPASLPSITLFSFNRKTAALIAISEC